MSDMDDRPGEPAPGTAIPGLPREQERQWALFAHLSALLGFIIPFGNVIGPLVIWQIKKADMPFVDEQGKEALNFQITVTVAALASILLMLLFIGFLLLPLVAIAALVLTVIAAVKANGGEHYRYPLTWRPIT